MRFLKYTALLLILACLVTSAYAADTKPAPLPFVEG